MAMNNQAKSVVTVAASGNTVLATVNCTGIETIAASVKGVGAALDAFLIEGQAHPDAEWVTMFNTFSAAAGVLKFISGNLAALADGVTGMFMLDVRGLHAVRISASAASSIPVTTCINGS